MRRKIATLLLFANFGMAAVSTYFEGFYLMLCILSGELLDQHLSGSLEASDKGFDFVAVCQAVSHLTLSASATLVKRSMVPTCGTFQPLIVVLGGDTENI